MTMKEEYNDCVDNDVHDDDDDDYKDEDDDDDYDEDYDDDYDVDDDYDEFDMNSDDDTDESYSYWFTEYTYREIVEDFDENFYNTEVKYEPEENWDDDEECKKECKPPQMVIAEQRERMNKLRSNLTNKDVDKLRCVTEKKLKERGITEDEIRENMSFVTLPDKSPIWSHTKSEIKAKINENWAHIKERHIDTNNGWDHKSKFTCNNPEQYILVALLFPDYERVIFNLKDFRPHSNYDEFKVALFKKFDQTLGYYVVNGEKGPSDVIKVVVQSCLKPDKKTYNLTIKSAYLVSDFDHDIDPEFHSSRSFKIPLSEKHLNYFFLQLFFRQ